MRVSQIIFFFILDANIEIEKQNEQQLLEDKWQDFISCNPLPKPYIPADIRLFYNKLKYWEKENVEKSISWLLAVDEKSILAQNIFRQDLTRRQLETTLKENIGHEYNSYIKHSNNVLQRIETFLDNEKEVLKCPERILDDIKTRKKDVQQEIMDFLDRFTYRIISSENSEMESIDAITAEYYFSAFDFEIHIWCVKNVAVRFSHLSEPRLIANFHSINLQLQIPANMLKDNIVIRALHKKFDHLSENAKTFKQQGPPIAEHPISGISDLYRCLLNEWSMLEEMQSNILKDINQKYSEYQVLMQQYEEQIEKQKRRNDDEKAKSPKKIIKPKEPISVEEDMVPDIYDKLIEEEQKQYDNFMIDVFSPELLNLAAYEINLRKYVVLGGVYQLYYVQKPLHVDFDSFNMTWHGNESKLIIESNIQIKAVKRDSSFMRKSRRFTRRMTVFEAEKTLSATDTDCPWFIFTLQLPEYLCYWGEPIACQFEEITEIIQESQPTEIKEFRPSKTTISIPTSSSQQIIKPPDASNSDRGDEIAKVEKIQKLSSQESLENSIKMLKSLHIDDFSLLEILTQAQIRNLERHILPRIISSYKFPQEIQQEEAEVLSKAPKGRGGKIIRQKVEDRPQKLTKRQFTFDGRQNNPERVYTRYPKVEHINVVALLKELSLIEYGMEPETFAQLLQIVNYIKMKYKSSNKNILDLKPIEPKILAQNKIIKEMLRQKYKSSIKTTTLLPSPSKKFPKKSIKYGGASSIKLVASQINGTENIMENQPKIEAEESLYSLASDSDDEEKVVEAKMVTYSHWTTKYILKSQFDRDTRKFVIHTDRLGNFGFAFKRYEHFPFKCWTMEPSENNPDNEVVFTLDTQHVRCILFVTADGIRGHVTEQSKVFLRNPKMYLNIEYPIRDFKVLKKLFKDKYLNIFAEPDASFYIENGYFSEKHLTTELHTYNCMSVHSTQMHFEFSLWNRLAKRRDIILKFVQYQDLKDNLVEVRITPGEAFFVELQELCSNDLDIIKLAYTLTWRNIDSYSDLHHLILSMYPAANEFRCKSSKLICFIKDLLSEIRPLSFS